MHILAVCATLPERLLMLMLPFIFNRIFLSSEQEPAGCYWCILWLWKSHCQHAVHVLCWRCDNWRRRICSSRYPLHKDLENTKHRFDALSHVQYSIRNYYKWGPTTENANFVIALVVELSFAIFVGYRYRCVAPWGYSKVHRWASVWAC